MTIRDRKELKQTAFRRLQGASYPANKLILIHSGIALGAALLVQILIYLIEGQISAHSGLSGVQKRTLWETAASALRLIYTALAPFWSIGVIHSALRLSRGHAAYPHTLAEGFRRFGPVLRLELMQMLIFGILAFAAMYASSMLFMFTPAGMTFAAQLEPMILSGEFTDYTQLLEALPQQMITDIYKVVLPIFAVLALVLMVPAVYRMRMASYLVMDRSDTGAWKAIRTSGRIMRRKGFQLFLLDLSYWWYFALSALVTLPAYADLLLPKLGISLPMEESLQALVGYAVYAVLMLCLEVAVQPRRQTVYALAFDALTEEYEQSQPVQYSDVYGNVPKDEE